MADRSAYENVITCHTKPSYVREELHAGFCKCIEVCLGPLLSSRGFPGCPAFAYSIVKVQIRHDKKAVDLVTQKGKIDRLHLW